MCSVSISRRVWIILESAVKLPVAEAAVLTDVGICCLEVCNLSGVDTFEVGLGFRLLGPCLELLEVRYRDNCKNTDDSNNNHQLDEGKTLLAKTSHNALLYLSVEVQPIWTQPADVLTHV